MNEAVDDAPRLSLTMVCARYPPFVGGTESHVAEVSRRLVNRGHSVSVLTTVLERELVGTFEENGVLVTRVLARPRSSDVHLAPEIHDLVRRSGSDLIHIQGYHTLVAPIAMSAAIAAGHDYVVTFHSGGHSSRLRRLIRPVQHRVLRHHFRRARQLVGVSDYETEMFRRILRLPDDMFRTITNGVSDEFVNQQPKGGCLPVVLAVGRLEAYKRHDLVISAIARVRHVVPDVRLEIVGDGPGLSNLRRLATQHYVADLVEFTSIPYDDRASMAATMAGSSVVALMSGYESQGIVGLEALATGCRLIVADGSALEELARHHGVVVVRDGDVAALAAAIVEQIRRRPVTARQSIPTWADTTSAVEQMYRDVMPGSAVHARP